MTTDERIARLRELDKNRTQGEWRVVYAQTRIPNIQSTTHPEDYIAVTGFNGQFIAAAPEMMQIINELQAKLKTAEGALGEALEMVREWGEYASEYFQEKWGLRDDIAKLEQALAEIRK